MTEWLRTTWVVDFSLWLSNTAACQWLQSHFVAIPGFQSIHILAIGVLFGSALMVNLRILGVVGGEHSVPETVQRYMPWLWWALVALIASGMVLLVSEPVRNMVNPFFWIKMTALLITVLITAWFHLSARARMTGWDRSSNGRGAIRAGAAILIILWCIVMAGGRWIAYAPA
ncbi:MAG: hypothetical protein J7498_15160 [Sphingobium sp.]|nr:hypothetical protein [Sphingobium sp.]